MVIRQRKHISHLLCVHAMVLHNKKAEPFLTLSFPQKLFYVLYFLNFFLNSGRPINKNSKRNTQAHVAFNITGSVE